MAQLNKALAVAKGQAKTEKLKGSITSLQEQLKVVGVGKRRAMLKDIHARLEIENKPLKKSSSMGPDGTKKDHYWEYQGGKAGGVHGAGEEGGVHALENEDGQFVDLDGNVLNVLSDDDQAIRHIPKKFTVIRDNDTSEINTVRYADGDVPNVKLDKKTNQLIAEDGSCDSQA